MLSKSIIGQMDTIETTERVTNQEQANLLKEGVKSHTLAGALDSLMSAKASR
jgi:hypothetical protein